MMVKPADADGDVEMDAHASTDAVDPHAAAVRETSQEEEEEEEDAMAALLGVGREIGQRLQPVLKRGHAPAQRLGGLLARPVGERLERIV